MMHNHLPTTLFLLLLTTRPFSLVSASPSPAQESTRIVTVTSMASVPTSTSYSSTSDFQDEIMAATNFYRAEQNVTSVKWCVQTGSWFHTLSSKMCIAYSYALHLPERRVSTSFGLKPSKSRKSWLPFHPQEHYQCNICSELGREV